MNIPSENYEDKEKKSKKEIVLEAILNDINIGTISLFTNMREQYMFYYHELYNLNKGLDDTIAFKIRKLARDRCGITLSDRDLTDILEELNAIAYDDVIEDFKARVRCFYDADTYNYYYFIANNEWGIIEANEEDIITIIQDKDKPMFIRTSNMLSCDVEHANNRDYLTKLLTELNYGDYAKYLKVVITAGFIDAISKPYLLLVGDEGSTKSTLADIIKEIIDKGETMRVSLKYNISDIALDINENYVIIFDNISKLTKDHTDFFCIMYDTGGYTKRQLYTNNKMMRVEGRKFIIFTAINEPTKEKDFLDRCRILRFNRRRNNSRLSESEIRNRVDSVIAKIRWQCISTIAKAILTIHTKHEEIADELRKNNLANRSLEWLIWCEAIARVYGYEPLEFARLDKEICNKTRGIEEDIFKQVIISYLEKHEKLEAYARDICDTLIDVLNEFDLSDKRKKEIKEYLEELKVSPKKVGKRLGQIKSDLIELGYNVDSRHTNEGSKYMITKVEEGDKMTSVTSDSNLTTATNTITQYNNDNNNALDLENINNTNIENPNIYNGNNEEEGLEGINNLSHLSSCHLAITLDEIQDSLKDKLKIKVREDKVLIKCLVCNDDYIYTFNVYDKEGLEHWYNEMHVPLWHNKEDNNHKNHMRLVHGIIIDKIPNIEHTKHTKPISITIPKWLIPNYKEDSKKVFCKICNESCYPNIDDLSELEEWARKHNELFHKNVNYDTYEYNNILEVCKK